MPLASGNEVVHEVQRWCPTCKIVVLTAITSPGLLAELVEMGVAGLFAKGAPLVEMFSKLPLILEGGRFVSPELVGLLEQSGDVHTALTPRERQVLNMVIAGKSNKEIARDLSISPKTVDKHRTSVMQKLRVHSLAELMARALKDGLIESTELKK